MKKVLKIPMSDNTISRRISDMFQDVESQVIASIKEAKCFVIQLDESTDITGKARLLTFIWFVCKEDIIEIFLFCKLLPETRGQDIFEVVDNYFSSNDLSWKSCISICTDGAPSMSGSLKWFIALAKQKNPVIVFTHCFLHRKALISKSLVPELQKVLHETIKIVNLISKSILIMVFNRIWKFCTYFLLLHCNKMSLEKLPFIKKYETFRYRLYSNTNLSKNKKTFAYIEILVGNLCLVLSHYVLRSRWNGW